MENVMNTDITEMGFSKVNIDEPEVAPAVLWVPSHEM